MADAAERAREFKRRQAEKGLVQINVWVPADAASEFQIAAQKICADRSLRIGRLVDLKTGRMRGLNR